MRSSILKLLALVMALGLIAAACGDDDSAEPVEPAQAPAEESAEEPMEEPMESGDIVSVAVDSGEFPTLVAAVEAAGLVETLQGEGPFTVFAPTEAAFEELLTGLEISAEDLLADTELLTSVLTYHVVPGNNLAADVVGLDGVAIETVNGATAEISVDDGGVMVNDANVIATDVIASNGVIHVIDSVLIP